MRNEGKYYVISIQSRKGGVGKTTTALNLARILLNSKDTNTGRKSQVFFLDLDMTGTSVEKIEEIKIWKECVHIVEIMNNEGKKISDFNIVKLFKDYMSGEPLPDVGLAPHTKNKLLIKGNRINIFPSFIKPRGSGEKPYYGPSILFDEMHSNLFIEMLQELVEKCIYSEGHNDFSDNYIIIDNSSGYSGLEPEVEKWLINIGPERGKFLFIASLDPQDLMACQEGMEAIFKRFKIRWALSRQYLKLRNLKKYGNLKDIVRQIEECVEQDDIFVKKIKKGVEEKSNKAATNLDIVRNGIEKATEISFEYRDFFVSLVTKEPGIPGDYKKCKFPAPPTNRHPTCSRCGLCYYRTSLTLNKVADSEQNPFVEKPENFINIVINKVPTQYLVDYEKNRYEVSRLSVIRRVRSSAKNFPYDLLRNALGKMRARHMIRFDQKYAPIFYLPYLTPLRKDGSKLEKHMELFTNVEKDMQMTTDTVTNVIMPSGAKEIADSVRDIIKSIFKIDSDLKSCFSLTNFAAAWDDRFFISYLLFVNRERDEDKRNKEEDRKLKKIDRNYSNLKGQIDKKVEKTIENLNKYSETIREINAKGLNKEFKDETASKWIDKFMLISASAIVIADYFTIYDFEQYINIPFEHSLRDSEQTRKNLVRILLETSSAIEINYLKLKKLNSTLNPDSYYLTQDNWVDRLNDFDDIIVAIKKTMPRLNITEKKESRRLEKIKECTEIFERTYIDIFKGLAAFWLRILNTKAYTHFILRCLRFLIEKSSAKSECAMIKALILSIVVEQQTDVPTGENILEAMGADSAILDFADPGNIIEEFETVLKSILQTWELQP